MKKIRINYLKSAVFFTKVFCLLNIILANIAYAANLTLVIDDMGYHATYDQAILTLPQEVAIAIIPSAPYAKQHNQLAYTQKRDILIHYPMQPIRKVPIEKEALRVGMSEQDVAKRIHWAKKRVSHAIGLNNHMGSAATKDPVLMSHLMKALLKENLAFLDSLTISSSVAGKIAQTYGVNTLTRHIFLDDKDDEASILQQFQSAIQYARCYGNAIAIGHPRAKTIKVLQQQLANLPHDIQLVNIGRLWYPKKQEHNPAPIQRYPLFSDLPTDLLQQTSPVLRGLPY